MASKTARSKTRYAVVVLGMHRSGTSALSGVLAELGCDLPSDLYPANEFNPKGHFESKRLANMNDDILESGGSLWNDWGQFHPGWYETAKQEEFLELGTSALNEEFGSSRLFVLKDPRICRLMPFWQQVFAETKVSPIYVHTHRNPLAVAKSLGKRNSMPEQVGLLLWLRHILDAEQATRGQARSFVSYEFLMADWWSVVDQIQTTTGCRFPRFSDRVSIEIDGFLTQDLQHHVVYNGVNAVGIPVWVRQTWEIFERWVSDGEAEEDFAKLDAIRHDFNKSGPGFAALIETLTQDRSQALKKVVEHKRRRQDELTHASEKYAELEAIKSAFEAEVQTLRPQAEKAAALEAEAKTFQDKLAQAELSSQEDARRYNQVVREFDEVSGQMEDLTAKLEESEQARWQLQSSLAQRRQEVDDTARMSTEYAKRADRLEQELDQMRQEHITARQEVQQQQKNTRLIRVQLQNEKEEQLKQMLQSHRRQADGQVEKMRSEILDLRAEIVTAQSLVQHKEDALHRSAQDHEMGLAERERLSDICHTQTQRIEELERMVNAYAQSTSWKITSPLRRLVLALRRKQA